MASEYQSTSLLSRYIVLEEAFRLPSIDDAYSASISKNDFLCLDILGDSRKARKTRKSACKHIDATHDRTARFDRWEPSGDITSRIIISERAQSSCSRAVSQSTCTLEDCRSSMPRRSTRATYNFHIGLLTHSESNKTDARSNCFPERASARRSSCQAHDELWGILLQ